MRWIGRLTLLGAVMTFAMGAALAQTKLKWAHVYETSEPYHKWSVWAAGEIEKRTNGKYHIDVFPASTLGKESDLNQGFTSKNKLGGTPVRVIDKRTNSYNE